MENEVKEQELFIPKAKHKGLKIILAILIIAGLGVGGFFLYQHKFNNPKTIVNSLLEDAKKDVGKSLVEEIGSDAYKVDGHIKIDTNLTKEMVEGIDILKDIELQFGGEVDSKNNVANVTLNTKYKSDKLVDVKAYYEKDVLYFLLDGIYDKYLKADMKDSKNGLSTTTMPDLDISPADMQALSNGIIDAMQTEVNKLDFKKEDAKITIDGKDLSVINNYVELRDKAVNEFAKGIVTNLSGNTNFTDLLKKLTGEDPKTILDGILKEINEDEFKGTYKICFYTDNGLFSKKLVSVRQTITQDNNIVSIDVDKISDDDVKLSVSASGAVFSIKVKKNSSAVNVTLNVNSMGYYLNAEINTNYEKIKEVTKPDVSKSKDINSLTNDEVTQIEKKLSENKAFMKLIDAING